MSTTTRSRTHPDAPDTEADFLRLAALGPGRERERLREDLVRAWLPMAYRIATRYRDRGEALDDLRQVSALALVKAVDGYDPALGHAFESYAVPTVTGEVRRHFRDHSWTLRVPRRVQENRNRVRIAYQELSATGHQPAIAILAERTRLDDDDVREALGALHAHSALSLDAPVGPERENSESLADCIGSPDPGLDAVVDREAVKPLIADLPYRERRILYLRFFREMTQARIADEFGLSQMHISRLIATTCERIRESALEEDRAGGGAPERSTAAGGARRG
jgi:RNA polymerase sigma-B factor